MDNKEKIVKLLNIKYDTYKEILERNYELKFKNYFEKYVLLLHHASILALMEHLLIEVFLM